MPRVIRNLTGPTQVWVCFFPPTTFTSDFTLTYYTSSFLPQQTPSSSLTFCRLLGITSCYYHFRFHAIPYWFLPHEGTQTPENSFDLFKEHPEVLSSLLFFFYLSVLCCCFHKDIILRVKVCDAFHMKKQNQSRVKKYGKFHIYIKQYDCRM